tara:strand:+ start:596 stop:847 length:252 start_codon:yes stop_codon:yes gene_type:complete
VKMDYGWKMRDAIDIANRALQEELTLSKGNIARPEIWMEIESERGSLVFHNYGDVRFWNTTGTLTLLPNDAPHLWFKKLGIEE